METTANLFEYINTPYSEFNKCAFQLFLENRKKKAFADDELPLAIFSHIFVLVTKYEKNVFSFIEEYTTYIEAYNLTFQQEMIIYSFAKKIFSIPPRNSYFADATQFAAYFKMLEEIAVESQMEAAGNDVSATALHIINMQVLKLQEEIEREPLEQRMKLIATLVKIITQYQKLTAPAKTKPETINKNKPQITTENVVAPLTISHIPAPAQIINEKEPLQAAASLTTTHEQPAQQPENSTNNTNTNTAGNNTATPSNI